MKKIRKNACRKLIWTGKEMQDYIVKNSGLKYSITHVRYLIRRWGYSQKVPVGVHARRAPSEDRHAFQKEIAEIIQKNNDDRIVTAIQDETIVIAAPGHENEATQGRKYVHCIRIRARAQKP